MSTLFKWFRRKANRIAETYRETIRRFKLTKVVWTSHDWDAAYFYRLVAQKLRNVLDYQIKDSRVEYPKAFEDRIRMVIKLCDHLSEDKQIYPDYINVRNARMHDPMDIVSQPGDLNESDFLKKLFPDSYKKIDLNRVYAEEVYDLKARYIVNDFLTHFLPFYGD